MTPSGPDRPAPLTGLSDRDALLAERLGEQLRDQGWAVRWTPEPGGAWRAAIVAPGVPHPVVGRGRSRLAAISAAHVDAFRFLTRHRPRVARPPITTRETSAC